MVEAVVDPLASDAMRRSDAVGARNGGNSCGSSAPICRQADRSSVGCPSDGIGVEADRIDNGYVCDRCGGGRDVYASANVLVWAPRGLGGAHESAGEHAVHLVRVPSCRGASRRANDAGVVRRMATRTKLIEKGESRSEGRGVGEGVNLLWPIANLFAAVCEEAREHVSEL